MSHVGIFVYGSVVSLVVLVAFGLMLWASIADGREQRALERTLRGDTGTKRDPVPAVRTVHVD